MKMSIKFYLNVDIQKQQILNENRNKSGIYKLINIIINDFYIGSAKDLSKRLQFYYQYSYIAHPDRGNSKICYALWQCTLVLCGLEIIEYCKKEELIIRE